MKTVLQLKQELGALADEARQAIEAADAEDRDMTSVEEATYTATIKKMDALRADIERREKLEGFSGVSKPQGGSAAGAKPHPAKSTPDTPEGIYCRYLRTGDEGAAVEMRASNATDMNVGTAADGGDLVPVGHYNQIIARRDEMAIDGKVGIMDIPGVGTTVDVPVDNEADGEFVSTSEAGTFDLDAPAVAKVSMTLVLYSKRLDISYQLLQDEDSRLLPFIENWVGRGMARTMNNLMITEALANGTAALTLASPTTIAAGEVPTLIYKQAQEYEDGSVFIMRRATQGILRSIASSSMFTFGPGPGGAGSKTQILDFPVFASQYAGAASASGKSMIFGNFGFMGRRLAPAIQFLRDPYTLAVSGQVRLLYYFRTVFKVLQAEAIQYATQASA